MSKPTVKLPKVELLQRALAREPGGAKAREILDAAADRYDDLCRTQAG